MMSRRPVDMELDADRDRARSETEPPARPDAVLQPARAILALQRAAGNAAVGRLLQAPGGLLQRGDPTAAEPFTLGGARIETYADATVAIDGWCLDLEEEADALSDDEVAVPEVVETTFAAGLDLADTFDGGESEPLDAVNADELRAWYADYVRAINAARSAQATEAAARAEAAGAELQALRKELKELERALRDVQRDRFRGEDEDGLLATADAIATVVDTGLAAKTAIDETLDVADGLRLWAGRASTATTPRNITGKVRGVLEALEKINKAYAGVQLVRAGVDLVTGDTTESEGGREAVEAMSTVVSAGGTLLNASAGFTLYANLYIGPMTSACLSALARLEDQISKSTNRTWIELGRPDYVNWSLEPGGRPMFDFMIDLMRADGASDVPTPPAAVDEYFVDNENEFDAGVGSDGREMPTEGAWFWKETDKAKIKRWAFRNRRDLWGMLYGSAAVPRGRAF